MSIIPMKAKSEGGKKVGAGCQARIDQAVGCTNKCAGCYAKLVTRRGEKFDVIDEYVYDEEVLRKSFKSLKDKDINVCRCGSICDPGKNMDILLKIILAATGEGIKLVVATKSLTYDKSIALALKAGNHMLQVSFGMLSDAPSDDDRFKMMNAYKRSGVEVVCRIVADSTVAPSVMNKKLLKGSIPVLFTPLRVRGYTLAALYNLNTENYSYHKGYLRPILVDKGWGGVKICGEVDGKVHCANCLVCA